MLNCSMKLLNNVPVTRQICMESSVVLFELNIIVKGCLEICVEILKVIKRIISKNHIQTRLNLNFFLKDLMFISLTF